VVAVVVAWFWRRHQRLVWERRRLARAAERLTAARRAVADAAAEARSTVEGATHLKPGHQQEYQGRLRRLDQRRARLEEQTPPAALPDDLSALAAAYRTLTEAVRFSLASLTMTASELKNRQRHRARPPASARYAAATGSPTNEPDDDPPSSYSSDPSPSSSGGGGESRDGGDY
jgi:hypothetical protein